MYPHQAPISCLSSLPHCHLQIYLTDLNTSMEALKVNDTLFKGEHSTDEILKYYNEWAETGKYDEVRHIV